MKKSICFLIVLAMLFSFASCSIDYVTMPYSSEEYKSGEWSVEKLVAHFEELGFEDVEIESVATAFGNPHDEIYDVMIEDTSAIFTTFNYFKKGENFDTYRKVKIRTTTYIETLKTDNCPKFDSFAQMKDSPEKDKARDSFLNEHLGEYIEFEGIITDWSDKFFFVGYSLSVAVGDSNEESFSWNSVSLNDLKIEGYESDTYKTGMIREGMRVHIIAQIINASKGPILQIVTMKIVG